MLDQALDRAGYILGCLIDEVDDDEKYNDWDRKFVWNVYNQYLNCKDMTPLQMENLERVFRK